MVEFGRRVFWKRNPVFVLIFHLWENFCHWQFKRACGQHYVNLQLRRYLWLYWIRAESLRWVEMSVVGGKAKTEGKKDGKSRLIFVSNVLPSTHGPCFGLRWESQSRPLTRLLRLTWFWLSHFEFDLTPCPRSSRVTSREQQINPMCQSWHDTMFSRALPFKYSPTFHLHAFDVKLSLVQSFLWVISNSTSLQSLWCVTNLPPLNPPHPFQSHPSTRQSFCLFFFFCDVFFFYYRAGYFLLISLFSPSHHSPLSPRPFSLSVSACG